VKKYKIKSFSKINLSLRVLRKRKNYHEIASLITFSNLHDVLTINKIRSNKDKIFFSGRFKNGINSKKNTISSVLYLLRKKNILNDQNFKISIKKNIPHGSGLGGGSSNAATLLNFLNSKMRLKLSKLRLEKIALNIGSDVPVCLERKNTILTKKSNIERLKKRFKLNILIVYPNIVLSTKKIYKKQKEFSSFNKRNFLAIKQNKKIIPYLQKEKNDLQKTVVQLCPKVEKIINFISNQKGCYLSRITGSGSACIGIFSNIKSANYVKKLINLNFQNCWCVVSKTI